MSQANRLKLRKNRELQRKQKFKHGETKKTGSAKRGYRTLYWNQKTGSWQSVKPKPLIRKVEVKKEKPLTRAQKLEKGMATWNTKSGNKAEGAELPGSKMVDPNSKDDKPTTESKAKTNELKDETVSEKIESTTKGGPVKSGVEYAKSKGDKLAGYRRQKDTRITKKLKKAGFTEDRLAKLRKRNAAFQKAKKGGKKAMEEYRKKYPKRG